MLDCHWVYRTRNFFPVRLKPLAGEDALAGLPSAQARAGAPGRARRTDGGINQSLSMFLYRNFSNKSATSFRQSGNNCRARPAIFAASEKNLPGAQAGGKFAPEQFFRVGAKSMFKRI